MKNSMYRITHIFLLTVFTILVVACDNTTKQTTEALSQTDEISEESGSNNLIDDPENEGEKMLLGLVNKKGFENDKLFPWMEEEFESYLPNEIIVDSIASQLKGISIKAFMGTWCEDSQQEIPRVYKILDMADYDLSNMKVVAVSHDKDTPSGLEKGLDIEYVPTIIFYKDGKELGRFVEYAQDTLEKDMLAILTGALYKHAYED